MTTRRLLCGVLAWPHQRNGEGSVAKRPASIPTGTVLSAEPDKANPRVAVVRYAGKLYRLPMEYLAPAETK